MNYSINPLTLAELSKPPTKPLVTNSDDRGHFDRWAGFPTTVRSRDEAWEYLQREYSQGWPEGAAKMGAAADLIVNAPIQRKLRIENGFVSGFDAHVPTLINGRPDAWRRISRSSAPKAVKIAVGIGGGCLHTAENLAWSGALVVAVAEQLTARNVPVEVHAISACFANLAKDTRVLFPIVVKEATDNLIVDQLAAVIASPRTIRLAIFAHMSVVPDAEITNCGFWPVGESELNRADLAKLGYDAETILVPQVYSREAVIAALTKLNTMEG